VEMKVAEIVRKYGDRLSDEQKTDVLRVMAESQPGLDKMRAFLLQNGDQPATVFHAYREASADSGTSLATGKKTKGKK
jgi:hypothetical protein